MANTTTSTSAAIDRLRFSKRHEVKIPLREHGRTTSLCRTHHYNKNPFQSRDVTNSYLKPIFYIVDDSISTTKSTAMIPSKVWMPTTVDTRSPAKSSQTPPPLSFPTSSNPPHCLQPHLTISALTQEDVPNLLKPLQPYKSLNPTRITHILSLFCPYDSVNFALHPAILPQLACPSRLYPTSRSDEISPSALNPIIYPQKERNPSRLRETL